MRFILVLMMILAGANTIDYIDQSFRVLFFSLLKRKPQVTEIFEINLLVATLINYIHLTNPWSCLSNNKSGESS